MPDALLSSSGPRPTPITPSFSDRAKLESNFLSTDASVGSGEKLGANTIPTNWKSAKIYQNASSESFSPQTSSTHSLIFPSSATVAASTPSPQDMSAPAVNGDTRHNKVSSSTNNLFSSSCQPMRNTPNGESFAKVLLEVSLVINSHAGFYRHFYNAHDKPSS